MKEKKGGIYGGKEKRTRSGQKVPVSKWQDRNQKSQIVHGYGQPWGGEVQTLNGSLQHREEMGG